MVSPSRDPKLGGTKFRLAHFRLLDWAHIDRRPVPNWQQRSGRHEMCGWPSRFMIEKTTLFGRQDRVLVEAKMISVMTATVS